MANYSPMIKQGAKLVAKYGPQAKLLWDNGGRQAKDRAVDAAAGLAAKRKAVRKAETVRDGLVLKQVHQGTTIWVVFAHGEPIDSYPPSPVSLGVLLKDADISKAESPAEVHEAELRARLRRAAGRARGRRTDREQPSTESGSGLESV